VLKVCADPNNLPFSNERGEGLENRLAALLADELGAKVRYTWWAQRRGFVRSTLQAGDCDVVMGVPSAMDMLMTTRPYYRSTYVFVWRADRHYDIRSFDDPRLRTLRIGVQMVGDDFANAPPAHALANRGMVANVRGYNVYGDYAQETPTAGILDALVRGDVDVAVVWGPLAGWYAGRQKVPLELVPVSPQIDLPFLPMVFDIALGVRRGDTALAVRLENAMDRRQSDIDALLDEYHVPRVAPAGSEPEGEAP
jgi:mxaJ protein